MRVLRYVILKVISQDQVLRIKARNIVESCSPGEIFFGKTEKKESISFGWYQCLEEH